MKRCEYCGKQYANDVTACPVDGQPVTYPEVTPNPAEPRRTADRTAFNVKLISPLSRSGKYRIYVRGSDLIFIQTEGTSSVLNSIHGFLGPLGSLIPLFLWLFSRHKTREFNRRLEEADPEDLIQGNGNNFRLHLSEIRDAVMEPASLFEGGGRLSLSIRQGEKMKLAFVSSHDLKTALQLLPPLLPSTLRVNAEWKETHAPA
jgi:hypothetical protein